MSITSQLNGASQITGWAGKQETHRMSQKRKWEVDGVLGNNIRMTKKFGVSGRAKKYETMVCSEKFRLGDSEVKNFQLIKGLWSTVCSEVRTECVKKEKIHVA